MAFESWKPEIIAADVQHQLQKSLVYAQPGVINRNYEGDVQFAKSVRVVGVGGVTVFDVVHNQDMTDPETLADTDLEITIDYDKGFNFKIDNKDRAQTKIDIMSESNMESAYAIADAVDQAVATCYVDASAANLYGSDASPKTPNTTKGDAQNIFRLINRCGRLLKDSKVPAAERKWMIVPPAAEELLVNELHENGESSGTMGAEATLNGSIGKIGGFDILVSHNVPNTAGTKYKVMFGTARAITFASQVNDVRVMDMEKQFAKKVDGEYVFGRKVIRPERLGVLTCNFS
jgi:hypothetical protein